jgi:23S rRNA-/tRNA-specific pseudouridylate synthase
MSERHEFTITETDARRRLDEFLARQFGGISRMRLRQAVEQGQVTVGGAVVVPGHRLRMGERVAVEMGELAPTAMTPEAIPLEILYEDDVIAVVNKPAGMLSHPVRQFKTGTLANALAYHFNAGVRRQASPQASGVRRQASADADDGGGRANVAPDTDAWRLTSDAWRLTPDALTVRPGLAHRLDRATSGLMVVAKTDAALSRLTIAFQNRLVEKRYRALVLGEVAPDRGWVAAPIGRNPDSRPRWWVRPEGRAAETRYRVLRRAAGVTLLDLEPLTGRTNQLRIHCAWLGHPIAGDTEYGGVPGPNDQGRLRLPERLFLHASYLAFRHPITREWVAIECDLPPELGEFVVGLEGRDE